MRTALALIALLAAEPAFAHSGHEFGFTAGLTHPVFGADHLLAMALVGVWAAVAGGRRLWIWPATFVAALTGGAVAGHYGVGIPKLEMMIALSVLALGALVVLRQNASLALGVVGLSSIGFIHGVAHGAEAPGGSFLLYVFGFVIATSILHALGVFAGVTMARHTRWIGAAGVLGGLYFAVS